MQISFFFKKKKKKTVLILNVFELHYVALLITLQNIKTIKMKVSKNTI